MFIIAVLQEGQAQDLLVQHPELQIAYDNGITNHHYLRWILTRSAGEPVEDVYPVVLAFQKNQNLVLKSMLRKKEKNMKALL
jgi:hypothetical protein